ncbi:Glycerate kinase [Melipona quadrifasciata]|uniref:Glycerate kinase n=1 Tax=Melipona quadrifasciata TaxID=166423 RepID=A0A0M9A7A7_9HYME|nr:Glycerate kinase [Melipona quadrifasciata]
MSTDTKSLEKYKSILKDMYFTGVRAVSPKNLMLNKVKFEDGMLYVGDQSFQLKENVYLVGFGKAVMGMAVILEHMLGHYLKKGVVSVPFASMESMWESEDKSYFPLIETSTVKYREGSLHNQPDDKSLETTHEIIDLVEPLTENDTLIVLISGGGSALLYMPRPVIDHEDKLHVCKMLQAAGADIKDLNTVRSKLSMVKGGGLARMAYPATVISFILSDIVGDPIELIASGPTVYNSKRPKEVIAILKKYNLFEQLEGDVKKLLTSKETFNDKKLLTKKKKQFTHVTNIILGNNTVAIEAASLEAYHHKLTPIILRSDVVGDVHDVSLAYTHVTSLICLALDKTLEKGEFFEKVKDIPVLSLSAAKVDEIYNLIDNASEEGVILIGGGEPTVVVKGKGKGGRNQQLALHFSLDWLTKIKSYPRFAEYEVIMLSAGTDGQDGPTDAADESDDTLPFILRIMEVERMLPENTLKENDTYNFYSRFKKGSDLFKTGFTGTNVMDLHFIYIKKRKCGCKIDFGKEDFENDLDMHDLHIDLSTIEKYKNLYKREPFDWHKFLRKPSVVDEKADQLNIKITDDNLTDPCCRRDRKFPHTNLLKSKDLPL